LLFNDKPAEQSSFSFRSPGGLTRPAFMLQWNRDNIAVR
jgi:hypothetical protein